MKIKLWTKYNVGYMPTNRCRKLRYKEQEEYIDVEIKEISKIELKPAFDTGIMIYAYDNRLWREASEKDIHCGDEKNPMTALEALIYSGTTYSTYFGRCWEYPFDESKVEQREQVIARAEKDMNNYLIVDGKLYTITGEPMYYIITFGLGHNHAGIGTSLSMGNSYNPNISNERYFNALEYDKALNKALDIASRRGDTDSLEYIKNTTPIKVFDNRYVTRNPKEEHGNGNSFINALESMTESSNNIDEAALLSMCVLDSEINK